MQVFRSLAVILLAASSFFFGSVAISGTQVTYPEFGLAIDTTNPNYRPHPSDKLSDTWRELWFDQAWDREWSRVKGRIIAAPKSVAQAYVATNFKGDWTRDVSLRNWAEKQAFDPFIEGYREGNRIDIVSTKPFQVVQNGVTFSGERKCYNFNGNDRCVIWFAGEAEIKGRIVWYNGIYFNKKMYHQITDEDVKDILAKFTFGSSRGQ